MPFRDFFFKYAIRGALPESGYEILDQLVSTYAFMGPLALGREHRAVLLEPSRGLHFFVQSKVGRVGWRQYPEKSGCLDNPLGDRAYFHSLVPLPMCSPQPSP